MMCFCEEYFLCPFHSIWHLLNIPIKLDCGVDNWQCFVSYRRQNNKLTYSSQSHMLAQDRHVPGKSPVCPNRAEQYWPSRDYCVGILPTLQTSPQMMELHHRALASFRTTIVAGMHVVPSTLVRNSYLGSKQELTSRIFWNTSRASHSAAERINFRSSGKSASCFSRNSSIAFEKGQPSTGK
jgi:hypothetical protein